MATAIEILKAIRDNSDKLYNERVPLFLNQTIYVLKKF